MLKKFGALAIVLLFCSSSLLFSCDTPDETSVGESLPLRSSSITSSMTLDGSLDGSADSSLDSSLDSSADGDENAPTDLTAYSNLNDALKYVSGTRAVKISDVTLTTSYANSTMLGALGLDEVVIDGLDEDGNTKAKITAIGAGHSIVRGKDDATLHFKNVEFYDETDEQTERLYAYLEFGGKLRFENCDFKHHIFLKDGTDAEFINCTFKSGEADRYGVWVADGKASFENCTFTGYRGLKIHEELAWDVENVLVKNCLFDGLMKKPGLAIGDIEVDPTNTFITVTGCTFDDCQPWDKVGSREGVDGFYESDTLTSDFGWTQSNNTVDGYTVSSEDVEYS